MKNKDMRTILFTHLGNKCFRTRDVSFGKGFKDRIGMLPEEKSEGPSQWKRIRTLTDYEYNLILVYGECRKTIVAIERTRKIVEGAT